MFTPSVGPSAIAIVICGVLAGKSLAGVITSGCEDPNNCLLVELTHGGSIQVDDKIFSGFTFSPTGSDPVPEPSQISVLPVGVGTNDPGLKFSSANQFLSGPNPQGQNFNVTYNVALAPNSTDRITDIDFSLDAPVTLNGTASITGTEVANCTGDTGLQPRREIDLTATPAGAMGSVDTMAPATSCDVFKQLLLMGGATGFAQLLSFENRFSESPIPEPSGLALLIVGLLLMNFWRRGERGLRCRRATATRWRAVARYPVRG